MTIQILLKNVAVRVGIVVLQSAAMSACSTTGADFGGASARISLEDIYVLRSVREERVLQSTWCTTERAGFAPLTGQSLIDDRLTMWAVAVDSRDGRVTKAKTELAGELHACFGVTADPRVVNFYTEGKIAGVSLVGAGDCLVIRPDDPEKGIATMRCYLNLRGLPAPYVKGLLTSSTLYSKAPLGDDTDPSGYAQSSIATIRLWRAR